MKKVLLQTIWLSLAIAFMSCSLWPLNLAYAAPERQAESIRLQLKWLHQFQFAGFYAAIEKGYYQAEGLEVTLQEGHPGLVPAEVIARDEAQFAVDTPSAMIQRQRGYPVVIIAAIFQHSPTIVLTRSNSGIETPHDLIGKRVMVLMDSDPEFLAMLAAEGVRPEQVTLVPHTFKLDEIIAGKVDAQTAYSTNEPRLMGKRGLDFGVMRPSHYAIDFYGDSLITSEKIARERPELVERFLRATRQGWIYAMDHPQEITDVILSRYKSTKSREDLLAEAESMRELVQPGLIEIGHMNPERWRQIASIFVKFGMLESGFSVDKMIYQNVRAEISEKDRRLLIISVSALGILLLLGCAVGVVLLVFNKRMASQVALRTRDLNESEERHRALFTAVSDPVLVAERDSGILVECNEAAERYFGRSREQLIGLPQRELHPPETVHVEGVTEDFKRVAASPGMLDNIKVLAAGGEVRCVEISASTFEIGESRLILGIFRDVTERKQADEALRESERFLRSSQHIARLGSWRLDLATNQVVWTEELYKMYGFDPTLPPPPYTEHMKLFTPESWARLSTALAHTAETGIPYELELETVGKDGIAGWMWVRGEAVKDTEGRITSLWGAAQDITDRKQANEKLRETAERLRLANKVTNDVIWDWDVIQDTQRWNEVGTAVFGWTEIVEHPVNAHWWVERVHPDDRERVHNSFFAVVNNPELDVWHDEYRFRKADGTDAFVLDRGYVLRDDHGKAIRMIGAMQDITDRKRTQEALLLAKEAAEAANHAKSAFLANMSHEIRTPLNGILGMLQLLETSVQDKEELQFCALAIQSANRLTTLLSDILDLSRVEASMMLIRSEPFNLHSALTQTIDLFEPVAVQTGVTLTRHLDPGLPIWVVGDSIRLQQVLTNLIGNSFKFTKRGHVHVEAYALPSRSNDTLRIFFAVEDTGCGIANADIGNLFQPFTQVTQGYTRNHQGAGLGLTISKQLVGLMGGNMAVESEEGVGSTFAFCVTFSNEVQPHDDEAALKSFTAPPVSLRILLAEDDVTTLFSISRLLEKSGHSVTVAHNGQEALEMHEANDFDLILMDVSMPVMDGIEACQRIRGSRNSHKRDIPIIALTAYAMGGDKEKFLTAGMSGYVAKPVSMESLMQIMAETLAEQRR